MMGENSDLELPPGFATPLAKTVPRNMHDPCQGEITFSINRGRGRPRKQTTVSTEAGVKDRASIKAKGSPRSPVVQSQLGQTNTSPTMQPQPGLTTEVKEEIEDVAPPRY